MNLQDQPELRFVQLMSELFQLDEAEHLDFGFYRVIRHHNQQVKEFLGEIVEKEGSHVLAGGELSTMLDNAFLSASAESEAGDRQRLKQLERDFGIKPGTNSDERQSLITSLEDVPALREKVAEYRSLLEQLSLGETASSDRREVLNRLYQFFSRHYQDGDFIVERRYGRDGSRYIRSTGEDTEFHWATEDMYYIKSGDTFSDFTVRLSNGEKLVFSVQPDELIKTRAILNPTDKAHYEIDDVVRDGDGKLVVLLHYLKGTQTKAQKNLIARAIQSKTKVDEAELTRWLNHFIARNQSDFFVHKRLGEALTEDLEIFIKSEVLNADQLLVDTDLPRRLIRVGRIVRDIGQQIIRFLAVLEDFQKLLWEKKKLVFDTRYVITIDRIAKLAGPEWLKDNIEAIILAQKIEWADLGLGDFETLADCREVVDADLASDARERWLPLPLDTKNFDQAFKWDLLRALTRDSALDDAIDGVAIRSDNWQALNTVEAKYSEKSKCVYIDPPYNTNASGIPYKNGYKHASWAQMMHNRIEKLNSLLMPSGAIFVSIDKVERTGLLHVLEDVFGSRNSVEELIWVQNTNDGRSPTYSTNHEYVEVFAKNKVAAEEDPFMFREPKPGFREVMELVRDIQGDYPSVSEIENQVKTLYKVHKKEYKARCLAEGWDLETAKRNDPWKGIYNYNKAEYRTADGQYVEEASAKANRAKVWIWRENDWTIMSSESKQSKSIYDESHPNYRFYQPIHPVTGKPCRKSARGWKGTQFIDPKYPNRNSFESLVKDHRIAFGGDEKKVPQQKRMLHEVDTNVGKSVFIDFSDGEKETMAMFGKAGVFLAPKHSDFVMRFIQQTTNTTSLAVDCFGGSGSTAHAVMRSNMLDDGRRKFLTVEVNKYFETLIVPRLKKASLSDDWKNGKAQSKNGPGIFMRVQEFEQYEDTLENLSIEVPTDRQALNFEDSAFSIRYNLSVQAHDLFMSIENFRSPCGYKVKRADHGGEAIDQEIDLCESLIYLLGLEVHSLYKEELGVVITGIDQRNRSVTILFRECDATGSAEWCETKLKEHPADRILTNDMAGLIFEGCENFEAIEAAFATQFKVI